MKVKNDHRSKCSNLSNWKEEAWKSNWKEEIPLKPWFFQASSFQLLKLENLLRWSFFTFILANVCQIRYFHQILHFCQNRQFQRESLCHRIWIFAQNFGECSPYSSFTPNWPYSSRSPVSKGHFAISFQFFLRLWYFQRGPLCHLIRHFRHNPLSKGPFVISFEFFPKLADVRSICHFRQNRHSQSGAFATS